MFLHTKCHACFIVRAIAIWFIYKTRLGCAQNENSFRIEKRNRFGEQIKKPKHRECDTLLK